MPRALRTMRPKAQPASRFVADAWPLGQDVCKLVKQRCREICPRYDAGLPRRRGPGIRLGHQGGRPLALHPHQLRQGAHAHDSAPQAGHAAAARRRGARRLHHGDDPRDCDRRVGATVEAREEARRVWASDWGVAEVKTPTGTEVCDALFKQPPLEWPRITAFQDRTMVLMCQRLLPEAKRDIYLQGASSFQLPKGHFTVTVCCSPHNPGARELADELNSIWPGLLQVADLQSWSDLASCDHFL
eukprot:3835311-Prymnesium_polylepis.1